MLRFEILGVWCSILGVSHDVLGVCYGILGVWHTKLGVTLAPLLGESPLDVSPPLPPPSPIADFEHEPHVPASTCIASAGAMSFILVDLFICF